MILLSFDIPIFNVTMDTATPVLKNESHIGLNAPEDWNTFEKSIILTNIYIKLQYPWSSG